MKRKFAVAAATAALITASLSFGVFADPADITSADPAQATTDYKDKVVVKNDPAGDTFEVVDSDAHLIDAGFIKVDGKVYYVADNGKFKLLADGEYTVKADDGGDTEVTVFVKSGSIVKSQFMTIDGKDYFIDENGAKVKATSTTPEVKPCAVKNGSTTTTYERLIAADGHIVKGWEKVGDEWFYAKADATVVQDTWVSTTAGRWFFVGKNGQMVTATNAAASLAKDTTKNVITKDSANNVATIKQGNKTYVVDKTGLWLNGWVFNTTDKSWYYYSTNGTVQGWVKYGTKWCYVNGYKVYTNEVKQIGSADYAFDKDGYLITGFGKVEVDPTTGDNYVANVYANAAGVLQSGYITVGGVDYFFADDTLVLADNTIAKYAAYKGIVGDCGKDLDGVTGNDTIMTDSYGKVISDWWVKLGDDWYYVNDKKVVVADAWVAYGKNAKCFMDDNGKMVTGGVYTLTNDGKVDAEFTTDLSSESGIELENILNGTVVINEAGAAVTKYGWVVLTRDADNNVTWGFADKNGKAYHGWVADNGKWYYIQNGVMLTNTTVDGCYLDSNGVWTNVIR